MKIGVTGANGQLGSTLRKIAIEDLAHTFIFSDLPELDITDKAGVEAWAEANSLEIIINCAAYTAVDRAESEPDATWRVNAIGPAVLGEVCVENDIKLVHISTDYVFDGTSQIPYTEDDLTHPLGIYGSTKRQGEVAIAESGCDALIVRTSWLYSEFGSNFVKTILNKKDNLRVVDDQIGSPTYAKNLAKAILHLIESGFTGCDTIHYADDGMTTWYDFARMIFIIAEKPITIVPIDTADFPTAAKRPAFSVLSTKKAQKKGVETPFWVDALKECLSELRVES